MRRRNAVRAGLDPRCCRVPCYEGLRTRCTAVLVSPSSLPCPVLHSSRTLGVITKSECLSLTLEAIDTQQHIEDPLFLTRRFPATINVFHVRIRSRHSCLVDEVLRLGISTCANVSTRPTCIANPTGQAARSVTKRNRDCPSSPCKLLTTPAASPLRGGLPSKTTSSPAHKKSGSLR